MTKLSENDLPSETATLRDIQNYAKKVATIRGYDKNIPTEMLFLTEEIGELAKAVRGHIGAQFDAKTSRKELSEEFHDVLINLLNMANLTGVDIFDAFIAKETADLTREWKTTEEKK